MLLALLLLFIHRWRNRKNFVKMPGRFFPMDIDLGGDSKEIKKLDKTAGSKSKLHKAIQDLVRLIFDVDTMKKAMVEFEVGCFFKKGKLRCFCLIDLFSRST